MRLLSLSRITLGISGADMRWYREWKESVRARNDSERLRREADMERWRKDKKREEEEDAYARSERERIRREEDELLDVLRTKAKMDGNSALAYSEIIKARLEWDAAIRAANIKADAIKCAAVHFSRD